MSTVFLSYCRSDQAEAARLAAALTDAGLDVWWDHLIEGGAAYAKRIESALESADAVVVLWSARSIESDWVLDEAARGRELRKLVPASLDGTSSPLGFRQYQTVDLTRWRGGGDPASVDALARAVSALAASVDGVRGPARAAWTGDDRAATPPAANRVRRQLLVGAISAVPLAGAGLIAWRHVAGGAGATAGNSVAVLPFDNLSGDAEQAYFSKGLSEEVRSTLARNLALQVMAKSSSSRFEDGDYDATEIARELGVAYLLDGSVRRQGDVVRVVADLVDGGSGLSRWSQNFERQLTDVFAVQSEIAYAVADALSAFVGGDRGDRESLAAVGGTTNAAALDAYLRGRALYDLSTGEDTDRAALRLLELALENDPAFASAHAARARALTAIANEHGAVDELASLYGAAVAAAERAIALAPMLAEAHSTLGFTLFQGRLDARAARAPFERSVQLGAGEATVLARFAQYAARCGRHDDAARALAPALVRDPLNPLIHRAAGGIAYAARRFEDSLAPLRKALSMNPNLSHAHAAIGDALLNLGDVAGALDAYGKERNGDMRRTGLAIAHHRAGDAAAAAQALGELRATGDRVLYQQAQVAAQQGRTGEALGALERARQLGDSGLIYSRNDPFLDPLREEPRFAALLDGLGFDASTAAPA
jgi:TolB-like protein/Flp pilus assembly protein TadD